MRKLNKVICPSCDGKGLIIPFDVKYAGPNGYVNCGVCSGSGLNIENIIERCDKIFGGTTWRDKLNEKD